MGRRKRRRKITRRRRTLPAVYQCPNCNAISIGVTPNRGEGIVVVKCAVCGISQQFEYNEYLHPVDYYAKFMDWYESEKTKRGSA